jgi:hypothetical protein
VSGDVPWVADEAARGADERRVAALVGRCIARVRYVELDYADFGGTPEPAWPGDGFDSLDYGLELDLDDGATWSFIWLQAGHNEGLLAFEGTLKPTQLREDAGRVWDVGGERGWASVLGRPVVRVEGAWLRHTWDCRGQSDLCVLTWVLHFDGDQAVVITLGDRDEDGSYRYSHENVAVFFSLDTARSRGVLLPGDPEAV